MSTTELREHQRFPRKLAVDVHVFVLPASPTDQGYEAQGKSINIGRGGILMRIDKEVRQGLQVRLRFWELPNGVRIWPLMVSGKILRLEPGEPAQDDETIPAGSVLAIEFTEPLKELEAPSGA